MLPLDGVVLAYGVHLPQLALDMEPVRHHLLLQSPSSTFKPSLTFGQTMQLPHHGGGVRVQGDLGLGGAVSLHLGGQVIPQVPNLVLQLAFSRSDPARRFFSPSSGSEKTEVAFFRLNINSVFSSLGGLCGVYPGAAGSTFFWGCSACVSGSPRSST